MRNLKPCPPSRRAGMASTEYVTVCAMVILGIALLAPSLGQSLSVHGNRLAQGLQNSDLPSSPAPASPVESPAASLDQSPQTGPWMPWEGCLALVCGVLTLGNAFRRRKRGHAPDATSGQAADPADELITLKRRMIFRAISDQFSAALSGQILVQDVMTRSPVTVQPGARREELLALVERSGFHHIAVVDGARLCGIMSDHDLYLRDGKTARELMTPDPISVSPEDHIDRAVSILLSQGFACLPVVENGQICGILTTTDLIMTLQCALRALENITTQLGVDPAAAAVPAPVSRDRRRAREAALA